MPRFLRILPRNLTLTWDSIRQTLFRLPLGGRWAIGLPRQTNDNLRTFWFDGLFAVACDNIMVTYLAVYILALGATRAQIGVMSALSSLTAALLLLPAALLVERIGHRKNITLIAGGGFGRLMILGLALIPLFWGKTEVIWIAVGLSVARDAFSNLAFPAWMSLTGDLVPLAGRGRYFGSRNFASGLAAMITTLLVGEMITRAGEPVGYQLALLLAFGLGMASTFFFSRIKDPQVDPPPAQTSLSLQSMLGQLRENPTFLTLCGTAALWNFSLNIASPFFNIYLVQKLNATAAMVGLTSVAASLSGLIFLHKLGQLADHWGPRRLQLLSMLSIPILPFAWVFVTAPWQVILINLASGLLWAAFNLGSFNFLLTLMPDDQRARYSAMYQIVVTISLAAGAAVGSIVVTQVGYHAVFILTAVGRLAAGLVFLWLVRPPAQPSVQLS
jgi:MFS family permease